MVFVTRYLTSRVRRNPWLISALLGACAVPPKPAEAPVATEELSPPPLVVETEVVPPPPSTLAVPTQCGGENAEGICGPLLAFVKDLCSGSTKPDIALMLFAKGSPWTRAFLRLNVDAWYTGSRSSRVGLKLDEEVVVLH